jgi:hypothetical protein
MANIGTFKKSGVPGRDRHPSAEQTRPHRPRDRPGERQCLQPQAEQRLSPVATHKGPDVACVRLSSPWSRSKHPRPASFDAVAAVADVLGQGAVLLTQTLPLGKRRELLG